MWSLFSLSLSQLIRLPSCLPLSLSVSFQKAVFRLLTLARPPVIPSVKTPRPVFFRPFGVYLQHKETLWRQEHQPRYGTGGLGRLCASVCGRGQWMSVPAVRLSICSTRPLCIAAENKNIVSLPSLRHERGREWGLPWFSLTETSATPGLRARVHCREKVHFLLTHCARVLKG